jgi:hypothetical protein
VLVNLDRVLMTLDWGQHFPLCKVSSLMRIGSDHAPIMVDTLGGGSGKRGSFPF